MMRRLTALWICIALLAGLAAGCSARPATGPETPEETAEAAGGPAETAAPETAEPPADTEPPEENAPPAETEPPAAGEGPAEPTEDEPSGDDETVRGHYSFQPKVCSSYMTEIFGEEMTEAWYALVDAVMAGEDTFACPDAHTYDWVMGQYPDKCFPILPELIDYCYDRSDPVHDGIGSFTYLVPREEAAARIAEFAALVEEILNSTLEDGDSDTEKALALYIYFSRHYIYDYEAARPDVYADYLSSYRVLTTGTGICQEFSVAYSYLLLQAGVDATNMSGHRNWDGASHQWSYVRINGHNFHIDPTYVIGEMDSLSYFMMTDEQRERADGYLRDGYVICSNYAQDHPHPDYAADDDSFREIWNGWYEGCDRERHVLNYVVYDEEDQPVHRVFDLAGW